MTTKTIQIQKLARNLTAAVRALPADAEGRVTYELSVSSELAVTRYGMLGDAWVEILDHSEGAVDFSRADGMPLLLEHDTEHQIGVVESLTLDAGARRLMSTVRFSRSSQGAEVQQDVADGIRRNVSLGYLVHEFTAEGVTEDGLPIYRATRWQPLEVSIVSVPADHTVGMGRAGETTTAAVVRPAGQDNEDCRAEQDTEQPADTTTDTTTDAKADATTDANADATTEATTEAPAETPADTPAEAPANEQPADERAAPADDTSADAQTAPADDKDGEGATSQTNSGGAESQRHMQVADRAAAALEIVQLATAHGHAARAADFLQRGLTVAQAARELYEITRSASLASLQHDNTLQTMDQQDQKNYSYARAIQVALGDEKGGLEAEIHQELGRNLPKGYQARGGVFVPLSVSGRATGRRALDTKSAANGGATVFTEAGELIDLLYAQAVVLQLGARMYAGLTGPVSFPKITGGATAHWVAENPGVDVEESELTFGSVGLTPRTLQSTTAFSRQLLQQSVIGIEATVRSDITTAHALAIDRAALHGAGGNEPTGVYNAAGVNVVDMSDGVTYGKLVDMVAEVLSGNALLGTQGFVTTPRMAGKLAQTLVAQAAGAGFIWTGKLDAGTVAGYSAVATNQVRGNMGTNANEHGLIFGNWADVLIGGWGALELVVDPYALKKQGLVEITSFQLADVALRHGVSFTKATGAKLQ